MKSEGKVQVVVRSRRVPVRIVSHTEPVYSASGVLIGSRPSQLVLFGERFDDEDRRTIEEAQRLACDLGLGLEVVDKSKSGFGRHFSRFVHASNHRPSMVVSLAPLMVTSDVASTVSQAR